MSDLDWKFVSESPDTSFGWFAVAINPVNYPECDLAGLNAWRESFGFTKAWYNNGDWWEPDYHGRGSNKITDRVTHWAALPEVPVVRKVESRKKRGLTAAELQVGISLNVKALQKSSELISEAVEDDDLGFAISWLQNLECQTAGLSRMLRDLFKY